MRKLISLGLMALMFSLFSSQVFAGNEQVCDDLLADNPFLSPGLYGLCIAYQNAGNDKARDRIEANYKKKAGPGDPPLPGTGPACPCWDAEDLAVVSTNGTASACLMSDDVTSVDLAVYNSDPYTVYSNATSCFLVDPNGPVVMDLYDSAEERNACIAGIQILIEDDFDDIVCNGIPQ